MIEIELFQHKPDCGVHSLKIFSNGKLVHENETCTEEELQEFHRQLVSELGFLTDYIKLREKE